MGAPLKGFSLCNDLQSFVPFPSVPCEIRHGVCRVGICSVQPVHSYTLDWREIGGKWRAQ